MGILPPPLPLNNERALSIVICAIVFPTLSTLTILGRLSSRWISKAKLGADDYTIMLAMISVYAQMVVIIISAMYGGVGHHVSELKADNFVVFYKLVAAQLFPAAVSLGISKISICLLLIRIFSVHKRFRVAGWCVLAYNVSWMVAAILIGAVYCRPFAFFWEKSIKGGRCGNLYAAYTSVTVLNVVGDVMVIILPMHTLWRLQMSPLTKIGLSFIFALGFLNIIAGILRVVYWDRTSFSPPADSTWDATNAYIWSIIEPSFAIIAACAGLLRPFFTKFFPSFKRLLSITSKPRDLMPSKRSNGLRYSRHTENKASSTYGDEDCASDYPLEPLATGTIQNGPENVRTVVFDEEGGGLPNYEGTITSTGRGFIDQRRRLQKKSGDLRAQLRDDENPYIISVENSFSITRLPKEQ